MRPGVPHAAVAIVVALAGLQARATEAPGSSNASQAGLPAALPLRRDATAAEGHGWTTPLALLLLVGTGGAWAGWRRLVQRRARSPESVPALRVVRVSSQALTPQASLHAVQWNGEELLLACTAQQVSVIARRAARCVPEDKA